MLIAAVTKRHAANTRTQWSSKTNKSSQSLARNGLTHGPKCLPVQPQLSSLFSTAAKSKAGFELNQAAAAGDIGFLKKMVKDGVDINSVDYDQRTPLHVAAAEGNVDLCEYLLAQGASVNALDRWGNTPLMDALRSKRDEVVGVLKKHGGILSHNTEDVAASLCKAAKRGDLSELKRLIDSGADPNASDYDGRTPLHIAAAEGRVDMVQFLVSKGSNPNLVDRFGNTPLQDSLRIKSPNSKMLQKVLEKSGAVTEVDIQKFKYESKFFNELQKSLSLLCVKDSWPYAEAWVQSPDTNQIISTPSWFADANQVKTFASFRSASEKLKFQLNQGYVGQGWAKPKPELFQTSDEIFAKHGIKTGVTIPIQFGSQTIAVIVLLDTKPRTSLSNPSELFTFANRLFLFCFSALKKQNGEPLPVFEEQMNVVCNLIIQEKVFNSNLIFEEVDWFYNHLGIPDYYFQQFSPSEIAQHIHSFIAAKKVAQASGDKENIKFSIEKEESNFYICPSRSAFEIQVEKRIEKKMEEIFEFNRKNPTKAKASSVVYFQTNRPAIADGKTHLGMYVLNTTPFTHGLASEDQTDLWAVSSGIFMRDKTQGMKEKYQEILKANSNRLSPVFEVLPKRADGTIPLMIGFTHRGSSEGFITSLSQLLHVNGIVCNRKFIETFANGAVICTLYISPVKEEIINRIFEQIGVLLILPPFSTAHPTITNLFLQGTISIEQYAYIIAVTDFCYYFLNQRSEEYSLLANALRADPLNRGRLELLQRRLKRDAVTENRIFECVTQNFELMAEIYSEFEQNFSPLLATNTRKFNDKLAGLIKKNVNSPLDEQILNTFLTFNRSLLKTNFFKKEKSALSFRFTPKFLSDSDFPETPFGLFLSVGMDYVGFHVRFRDISRGGIRIIKSANPQQYNKNRESLFNENYNLAYTQQKKNKDIPEFGSKGTILLSQNFQFNGKFAFRKYVDSLLDLMLLDEKKEVVDYYGQQELLFLGPDEYTAEYMDFAAEYAKTKGYKYWKSFTTGKSPRIGGIPHDVYGMTTRSIHRYVLGVLAKNQLDESKVTKVQIGGPDGDLGSNEILISKDKTIAVVDGSGVVYDPRGVDRTELTRLAKQRSMIKDFDRTKLGAGGFVVLVTDREVQLPSGEVVESGLTFRNEFHLMPWLEADLFVPCGGRPESINAQNVDRIFKKDGSPRYKYIVEGANLFLTQDARLVLEKAGVVIYKDASANKGGVTSSSLEVLAALAFNDEEFSQHMQVKEGAIPAFYSQYVKEVQEKVEENANLEFECIWQEHQRTKTPRSLLTDQLSGKINSLNDQIQCSNLWEDLELRTTTLTRAIPKSLIDKLGLQTIVQRVPESYVKAIFGAYLSSKYVYQFGFSATEFSFFEYMYQLRKGHPL